MMKDLRWQCKDFNLDGNKFEFYDNKNNVYVKMMLENETLKLIEFYQTKFANDTRWELIARYKSKIIFAPGMGAVVCIYDEENKQTENIILDAERAGISNKRDIFCKIIVWRDCIYLLPRSATAIVKIKMISYEVEYYTQWYNEINAESSGWIFSGFGYQMGAKCYLPLTYQNKILCFDLDTEKHCIYNVENVNGGFASMTYDEKDIWLAGLFENKIYQWNAQTEMLNIYEISAMQETNRGFARIFCANNNLILVPLQENAIYLWSIETKEISIRIMLPVKNEIYKKHAYFWVTNMISETEILGCSMETDTLLKINISTGQVLEFGTKYSEGVAYELLKKIFFTMSMDKNYIENEYIDLEFLLRIISKEQIGFEQKMSKGKSDKYLLI